MVKNNLRSETTLKINIIKRTDEDTLSTIIADDKCGFVIYDFRRPDTAKRAVGISICAP